jgi:hypothetical protein
MEPRPERLVTGPSTLLRSSDFWLLCAVAVSSAIITWTFFHFPYLPMVDMPQHAAQLSEWIHLDDPDYGFAEQFELNWHTPYLLGYLLARPFVPLLGIVGALKFAVLLSVFATIWGYFALLRSVGQDAWLCLLALPLSFGFSFYFGFLNFLIATPLILASISLALAYAREPTIRRGIPFAIVLGITFVAHVMAFGIAAACAFSITARRPRSWRGLFRDYWPLLGGLFLVVPWVPGFLKSPDISSHPEQWFLSWQRIKELPMMLFATSLADRDAQQLGVIVLVLVVLSLGTPSRSWSRYGLLLLALLAFFLFPFELRGISFLYERFAALVIPGLILAAAGQRSLLPKWVRRAAVVVVTGIWISAFTQRMRQFSAQVRGFPEVVQSMAPKLRVRPLMFDNRSSAFPGTPLFLHFPAYYQAAKGGTLGYSFARYYTCFIHYRPGVDMGMVEDAEWHPENFNPLRELPQYDYFVVHSKRDISEPVFGPYLPSVTLETQRGAWWVYRAQH